jgi:hypothetical protein
MDRFSFQPLYLGNPGVLSGLLPRHILANAKSVVNDPNSRKQRSMTQNLVASIREEYVTPEIMGLADYINNMFLQWKEMYGVRTQTSNYKIGPVWTNYMKKLEFNPNHNHPGAIAAFVIWISIPYNIEDELRYNEYNNPSYVAKNSCFEFTYNMLGGKIAHHIIPVNKSMEGTVLMFPGELIHCVYPFFTSDGERISIAGNIYES